MAGPIPYPNISPEVFSVTLFGTEFALRWYALAYIVGILIGWQLVAAALRRPRLWRNETAPMTAAQLESLLSWIVVGVIAGGRLGYVLFYRPGYYIQNPAEILILWEGGMAFHGGLIGVVLAIALFARANRLPLSGVADAVALATPPALLLGRIANFINAELWGRPTDLPWAVAFPGQAAQDCPGVEGLCGRHPSQLYEAGLEGLLLGTLLIAMAFGLGALKRPWRIGGTFLLGYGVARFLVELVRQPDAQFVSPGNPTGLAVQFGGWGLTQGQILSLPMIVIGLALILWSRRTRPAPA
ncbi:prolipoprotein diacylglyceryl transferase [Pseudoroseicyclus aestuarii]|uniref:Phosphatidylglycerol--prolipoprotein diacylglyceryl transferase n=1 Tax=Pseudoroseicyclus aestuarii TaxID=1795041 RepID=A0A318T1J0_9RHOB|nr:prolipoprotein diacylglyceryl transferase [Pseudoroseicyclus aestuarii]PYE84054.1 prolipoprotein diacylglyceryl transferase [Pseudoroseicyclus aestuarii]